MVFSAEEHVTAPARLTVLGDLRRGDGPRVVAADVEHLGGMAHALETELAIIAREKSVGVEVADLNYIVIACTLAIIASIALIVLLIDPGAKKRREREEQAEHDRQANAPSLDDIPWPPRSPRDTPVLTSAAWPTMSSRPPRPAG